MQESSVGICNTGVWRGCAGRGGVGGMQEAVLDHVQRGQQEVFGRGCGTGAHGLLGLLEMAGKGCPPSGVICMVGIVCVVRSTDTCGKNTEKASEATPPATRTNK